jgi:hypothetical protein
MNGVTRKRLPEQEECPGLNAARKAGNPDILVGDIKVKQHIEETVRSL